MLRNSQAVPRLAALAFVSLSPWAGSLWAADAPRVRELRVQRVGSTPYFHVRLDVPADMCAPQVEAGPFSESQRLKLSRLPQLIPQDGKAWAVYQRLAIPHYQPLVQFDIDPRPPVPVQGLEFVGKRGYFGKAKFLLLYPVKDKHSAAGQAITLAQLRQPTAWAEVPLELDFSAASKVASLGSPVKRHPGQAAARDDLEGLWAEGQVARFAVLEALTPEFGFYGFACAAAGRKYGVAAPALTGGEKVEQEKLHRQLYETTTGAAAITESLQLHRLLNPSLRDRGQRTVDIWSVPGIDIAEHPWATMMAGKKPSPEPLAQLVPRDNYYIHFKSIRKFIEFGELLDQWGTNATRAYEMNSRDYNLKERYERQLCLKSTWLGKTFGPAVIRSLAITGSDAYLREGSDLTVIFHVANRQLFLAAVEPFLQEARKEFGDQLKESKADYHGISVEVFVTPLREVSLHRAILGEFVVYSNSPTGLRRVLDTHQGRLKSLADSLDFRYMRTVFRLEDKAEDGFAFLSDAFIRQLVGPASKIKEKRRLEALTSLSMVTNGAMFAAWETGALPTDHAALLAASRLKPEDIYTPEGKGVSWDGSGHVAVSDVYNTLQFVTPLIELPVDKITPGEEQDYSQFRKEYLNLWRGYFDPVGMRFSLTDKRIRVETYILPLIRSNSYENLRLVSGGGTTSFDTAKISPTSLVHFLVYLSPVSRWAGGAGGREQPILGDWAMVRLDDSPALDKLAGFWVRQQFEPKTREERLTEIARLVCQLPITAGVRIGNEKEFDQALRELQRQGTEYVGLRSKELKPAYKSVSITQLTFASNGTSVDIVHELNRNLGPGEKPVTPVLYHAKIDGAWYIGFSLDALKELIDRAIARREGKEPAKKKAATAKTFRQQILNGTLLTETEYVDKAESDQVNSLLYLAPGAATSARNVLRSYLEWESHRRAVVNCSPWYALYRCGLARRDALEPERENAALKYLGFVPVSPDGSSYLYEPKTDEMVNLRHGSLRQPTLHAAIEDSSPLGRLLDQFRTLRVDLRFREDGVNTVLTIERR